MSPWALLAMEIAFYSIIPLSFVLLRPALRLLYIFVYLAMVHLISDIFWSVYGFELTATTSVSAGSVAYAAVLMTILLLVMVGHDVSIVRFAVVLVILGNLFKAGLFLMTGYALSHEGFANTYEVAPELFSWSLWVTVTGGLLTICELFLYLFAYQWIRPHLNSTFGLAVFHVACYVGLLALDGLLFPLIALSGEENLAAIIQSEVTAKLIMGVAYSIPFALGILVLRSRIPALNKPALRVHDVFVAPRDHLLEKIEQGEQALAASQARLELATDRLDRIAALRRAISDLDDTEPVGTRLARLERALSADGGIVPILGSGLVVYADGAEIASFGKRAGGGTTTPADRDRLAGFGPWIETADLGDVVCAPIRIGTSLAATVELRTSAGESARLRDLVRDLLLEIGSLLRADVTSTRQRWSEREPIMSILQSGQATARFQPIVRLPRGGVIGYEGLIRFEPGISPEERFREAAGAGLSIELELLALRTIFADAVLLPPGAELGVNVSPATVLDRRLAGLLATVDRPITLELTEHQPIDDYGELAAALAALPNVQFGVDDAGSGYATLQHILQLRPAVVKLDMSWVQGVSRDKARQALIRAMASFAEEVGATLTAEGIEDDVDAQTLYELGVVNGQGFLYGRPLPAGAR